MTKNKYSDTTNNRILSASVVAVVALIAGLFIRFSGGLSIASDPESRIAVAHIEQTRSAGVAATRRAERIQADAQATVAADRAIQATAEKQVQNATATQYAEEQNIAATRYAEEQSIAATRYVENVNATSTAFPLTATQHEANAIATDVKWAFDSTVQAQNATATQVAYEFIKTMREKEVKMESWQVVFAGACLLGCLACVLFIVRIWIVHLKPLAALVKNRTRILSMARMVPQLARQLQELEERMQHGTSFTDSPTSGIHGSNEE